MAHITFEERLNDFWLNGTCDFFEVPAWEFPKKMIRIDQKWGANFKWRVQGDLCWNLGGNWLLEVTLEQWGGGEFVLPPTQGSKQVPFVNSSDHTYDEKIEVDANIVPEGKFKPAISITLLGPSDVPGPVAGMAEGPMMRFYRVGP